MPGIGQGKCLATLRIPDVHAGRKDWRPPLRDLPVSGRRRGHKRRNNSATRKETRQERQGNFPSSLLARKSSYSPDGMAESASRWFEFVLHRIHVAGTSVWKHDW